MRRRPAGLASLASVTVRADQAVYLTGPAAPRNLMFVTSCLKNPIEARGVLAFFARVSLIGNNQKVLHLTLDEELWGRS